MLDGRRPALSFFKVILLIYQIYMVIWAVKDFFLSLFFFSCFINMSVVRFLDSFCLFSFFCEHIDLLCHFFFPLILSIFFFLCVGVGV